MKSVKQTWILSVLIFPLIFMLDRAEKVEIGEYQLLSHLEGEDHDENGVTGEKAPTKSPLSSCITLAEICPQDWPPKLNYPEDFESLSDDDPILLMSRNISMKPRVIPYDLEPIEFDDLFMNYYNIQPKRSIEQRKEEQDTKMVYDGSSSLNDFTKDKIVELMDYEHYLEMMNKNKERKKRQIGCLSVKGKNIILKKIDDLYREITKDINDVTELQSEDTNRGFQSSDLKRCVPYEFRNSKICCNPEKPSIVLDSRSSPSQVIHIDRNTIEEIIQVDLPKNNSQNKCSPEQSSCQKESEQTENLYAIDRCKQRSPGFSEF